MYNAVKTGNVYNYNYKEFVCDTVGDMNDIETEKLSAGSIATVLDADGQQASYILSSEKKWVLKSTASGGSSDNSGSDDSSGGESAQSDWTQNDKTAADYIKNRPGGYTITKDGTSITGTVTGVTAVTGGYARSDAAATANRWGTALKVRVSYDGEDYVVERGSSYDVCLGDKSLTEYPFALDVPQYLGGGAYTYTDYVKTAGEHEITVTPMETELVKIPADMVENPNRVTFDDDDGYLSTVISSSDVTAEAFLRAGTVSGERRLSIEDASLYVTGAIKAGNRMPMVLKEGTELWLASDSETRVRTVIGPGYIILMSSTSGSTKRFKITLDDSGALNVAELTT